MPYISPWWFPIGLTVGILLRGTENPSCGLNMLDDERRKKATRLKLFVLVFILLFIKQTEIWDSKCVH